MGDEPKDEVTKEEPPKEEEAPVELSEEEKTLSYRKLDTPDLTEKVLGKFYAGFSIPTKEEGFSDIKYEWQDAQASASLLKAWIMEKKLVQRVDDLAPGEWFKTEWSTWQKTLSEWKKRHSEWKDPNRRKALLARLKEEKKKKKAEEARKAKEA